MVPLVVDDDDPFGSAIGPGGPKQTGPHRVMSLNLTSDLLGISQGRRLRTDTLETRKT